VYVADQTNRRVQVFDARGKFLFMWGEYGTRPGQFGGNSGPKSRVGGPQFVALDSAGNVYTTEGSVGRVQKFTADGKFLQAWGDNDDKPGSFGGLFAGFKASLKGPIGICIDDKDRLWVSAVSGRVPQFTKDGQYLGGIGGKQGSGPGEFLAPHGVAADRRGYLYVVDAYNHRIQKFAVPK
jgi:sugar lactone lactonase YvrE